MNFRALYILDFYTTNAVVDEGSVLVVDVKYFIENLIDVIDN